MAKYGWSSELTQKIILFSFLWILTKANLVIKNTSLFAADGDFSHLMNPSGVITSLTLISSGVLCLDKPDCVSFLFNPKTKQMQRLSYVGTPSGTGGVNVVDWRYYIITKGNSIISTLCEFLSPTCEIYRFCQHENILCRHYVIIYKHETCHFMRLYVNIIMLDRDTIAKYVECWHNWSCNDLS